MLSFGFIFDRPASMPLLLRLLLCLTLLANTAGGAWAAQGLGSAMAAPARAAATHTQACHDAAPATDAPMSGRDGAHAHDGNCCAHAGCDCLQHCGTSISLPATLALTPPTPLDRVARDIRGRGLPLPYQPVRPPIA